MLLVCTFLTMIIAVSCSQKKSEPESPSSQVSSSLPDSIDRISFVSSAVAEKWASDYHEAWRKILPGDSIPIRFFTIKTQDVLLAMGINKPWNAMTNYEYIRVNLGYDVETNRMKCFIQPVDSVNLAGHFAGNGLFFSKNGQISGKKRPAQFGAATGGDSLYVADLNTPCPNTCGN